MINDQEGDSLISETKENSSSEMGEPSKKSNCLTCVQEALQTDGGNLSLPNQSVANEDSISQRKCSNRISYNYVQISLFKSFENQFVK